MDISWKKILIYYLSSFVYMEYMYFLATRQLLYSNRLQDLNSFNRVYVFTCNKIYHLKCLVHVLHVLKIGAHVIVKIMDMI